MHGTDFPVITPDSPGMMNWRAKNEDIECLSFKKMTTCKTLYRNMVRDLIEKLGHTVKLIPSIPVQYFSAESWG